MYPLLTALNLIEKQTNKKTKQKCTAVVATPNLVAAKNDFPRSHLHHVQYYVTDYIPAAQTYVNTFPRPSLPSEWVWERD